MGTQETELDRSGESPVGPDPDSPGQQRYQFIRKLLDLNDRDPDEFWHHASVTGKKFLDNPDFTTNGGPRRLVWLTARETYELDIPEMEFIAWPIVATGIITGLAGTWKVAGKTTKQLAMCRAVAHGKPWFGRPTIKTPVVYLYEGPPGELKPGLKQAGIREDEDDIHFAYRPMNTDITWTETITQSIEKCKDVKSKLLIVDTRAEWVEDDKDRENNTGFARASMRVFNEAQMNNIGVLIAAHPTKNRRNMTIDQMFAGSGQWAAALGRLVGMWAYDESNPQGDFRRVIECVGRQGYDNNLPKSVITWHPESMRYTFDGPREGMENREDEAEALNVFPAGEENAERFEDIRTKTTLGKTKLEELRAKFLLDGRVVKQSRPGEKGGHITMYYRPDEVLPGEENE